ncbi:MAG: phage tail protein [Patulibacter minatonensis]
MSVPELAATGAPSDATAAPRILEARGTLSASLPAIHRSPRADGSEAFMVRWAEACGRVLDPVVALLDNLPAYVDPHTAPESMVDVLLAFVGMAWPPAVGLAAKRRLLLHVASISRTRGTVAGLRLVIELVLPDRDITIANGGVVTLGAPDSAAAPAPAPSVTVTIKGALSPIERAALAAVLADQLPIHTAHEVVFA